MYFHDFFLIKVNEVPLTYVYFFGDTEELFGTVDNVESFDTQGNTLRLKYLKKNLIPSKSIPIQKFML